MRTPAPAAFFAMPERYARSAPYAVAVAATAVAVGVDVLVSRWLAASALSVFPAAVLVATWFGGLGPGLLATGLTAVALTTVPRPPATAALGDLSRAATALIAVASCLGVAALAAALRDARDRSRADARAREAREARYRALIELAPDGIVTVDRAGRIMLANVQAHTLFGYEPGELPGRMVEELMPERFRQAHVAHRAAYMANPRTRPMGAGMDLVGLRKDGTEVSLEISLSPMATGDGVVAMAAIRDVTERKRMEAQITGLNADLARRVAELDAVNRELEAFSYSVSHDLRAPLRAIDGFSQALVEDYGDRLDGEALDYLRRVRAAAGRMGELIDDLLKLSRVTRRAMEREPVDLSAMARAVVEQLRRAEPDRTVDVQIADGLSVSGDPQLLRVALENLLGNAWKFTGRQPNPRIELGVTRQNGALVYFVRDNGAGFDMAYADKLFGAFQRLHAAHEFPGTGIGLATVQRIVTRHGGRVWAEAEPGKGATFYFTLGEQP